MAGDGVWCVRGSLEHRTGLDVPPRPCVHRCAMVRFVCFRVESKALSLCFALAVDEVNRGPLRQRVVLLGWDATVVSWPMHYFTGGLTNGSFPTDVFRSR